MAKGGHACRLASGLHRTTPGLGLRRFLRLTKLTPLVYKELHRVAIAERSFAGFHGTSDNADGCRPIFRFHHPQQAERPPQM